MSIMSLGILGAESLSDYEFYATILVFASTLLVPTPLNDTDLDTSISSPSFSFLRYSQSQSQGNLNILKTRLCMNLHTYD